MNQQPNDVASQEISTKPEPRSFEQELLGFAVDANELVSRIHSGQSGDLNTLIQSAIDERPDETQGELLFEQPAEMQIEIKDAA